MIEIIWNKNSLQKIQGRSLGCVMVMIRLSLLEVLTRRLVKKARHTTAHRLEAEVLRDGVAI